MKEEKTLNRLQGYRTAGGGPSTDHLVAYWSNGTVQRWRIVPNGDSARGLNFGDTAGALNEYMIATSYKRSMVLRGTLWPGATTVLWEVDYFGEAWEDCMYVIGTQERELVDVWEEQRLAREAREARSPINVAKRALGWLRGLWRDV